MPGSDAFDIKQSVSNSVIDLFDTMLDLAIELVAEDQIVPMDGQRLIGTLSFTGEVVGSINIQVDEIAGRTMTAAMLGMEPDEIESIEEIRDVIRETCNIVGGNLKSGLEDVGLNCAITTPSITSGADFSIETLNMDRYDRFAFTFGAHQLQIELAVKAAEGAAPEARARLTAVDVSQFSRLGLIESTGDTVIELFDVMLGMQVEPVEEKEAPPSMEPRMLGQVGFAGQVKGGLEIMVTESFAKIIACGMMGIKEEELEGEDELKDVIGEVTNIIAGNLKAAFNDSGLNCRISPPNITYGTDFNIETANMDRYETYAFAFDKHRIFVEVCIKIDEPAGAAKPAATPTAAPATPVARDTAKDAQAIVDAATTQAQNAPPAPTPTTAPLLSNTEADIGPEEIPTDALDILMDIPLELTVELGRSRMKIDDLLKMGPGSALVHKNLEGEPLDVLANETLVARGEVVVENEKYGIRITEIVSSKERMESLRRDPLKGGGL
ncbi:MAG: flagellar motor switch protein FliN [Pseudomonadota bacterium]